MDGMLVDIAVVLTGAQSFIFLFDKEKVRYVPVGNWMDGSLQKRGFHLGSLWLPSVRRARGGISFLFLG